MLPPVHHHCFGMGHEQFFIYCDGGSVYSGLCIPSQNGLPSNIMSISCHMPAIFSAFMNFSTVFTVCESSSSVYFCFARFIILLFMPFHGIELLLFVVSMSTFCALLTSTPLVQNSTCSLMISLLYLTVVNSHFISVIIFSLFMSLVNCSCSLLSFSLYSHSICLNSDAIHPFFYIFILFSYWFAV